MSIKPFWFLKNLIYLFFKTTKCVDIIVISWHLEIIEHSSLLWLDTNHASLSPRSGAINYYWYSVGITSVLDSFELCAKFLWFLLLFVYTGNPCTVFLFLVIFVRVCSCTRMGFSGLQEVPNEISLMGAIFKNYKTHIQ